MKRFRRPPRPAVSFLAASCLFLGLSGGLAAPGSSCHLERLRCEYLINPLGLDIPQPRLDWILAGSAVTPRHTMQTAYRILVASSPEKLAQENGDLWDSGRVTSAETAQIAYGGAPLVSRERCWWKVQCWDSQGQASAWSAPAFWEMGLLKPADWEAKWIQAAPPADLKGEYGPAPILRTEFAVSSQPITRARLYVTALGLYEMHLNGSRVGDHLLAPDWTDYAKRVRYQVYDVTGLVKPGANALAGLLGNGWYCGHIGNGGFQVWGKVPALLAQLEVVHADGSAERFGTNGSWKMHPSPIVSSDFMAGENYDARLEIPRWDKAGLDASAWAQVAELPSPAATLDGQVDQPVQEIAELHPKSRTEPKPGVVIYDLGQNMVGFVRLTVSGTSGAKITLSHAEMLNPDGSLYTKNLRGAASVDTYICKGGGSDTWQPRFTFHGFRYVEVSGPPDAVKDVTGVVIGSNIPRAGQFGCSDPAVNQLQSNIQWGMRGNYLAVPTDCPQRDERLGWMGDAEVFIRTAAYNGDIAAFFSKWLVDVADAQEPDGVFTNVSPAPGSKRALLGAPAWADAGVICPYTVYLMYGDKRILQQNLPGMARWVDWCHAHSTNLIRDHDRGTDYGDWLSKQENTPKDLIGTAYFACSAELVAKSYRVIGDNPSAEKYEQLFGQIKAAFMQKYVMPDGRLQNPTQTGYCLALLFDLLPQELRPKAAQFLEEDVIAHGNHLTTGFVGVGKLLPALCAGDKVQTAYHLFQQDTYPSWLFSVKQGATTIWERWDGWTPEKGFQSPSMNSFNHYSLGSCGEWMFDTVAGIGVDPTQPGFAHIIIRPRPGGTLTEAHAHFDSIRGRIATDWKLLPTGVFSLHLTVPVNATATVILPAKDLAVVSEGGVPLAKHPEIQPVSGAGGASCLVGSGDYEFTCQLQ